MTCSESDSAGAGVDFNDSTEIGQLNRVFAFTLDFLAGISTDTPVKRAMSGPPRFPSTAPKLASRRCGSTLSRSSPSWPISSSHSVATALADVAGEAYLVRDEIRWMRGSVLMRAS